MSEKQAETPLLDRVRYAVERMEQGARMILDAIPDDTSLSSASYGRDVTAEIAKRLRASLEDEIGIITFGNGITHDWRRCPCSSCTFYRDAQET